MKALNKEYSTLKGKIQNLEFTIEELQT